MKTIFLGLALLITNLAFAGGIPVGASAGNWSVFVRRAYIDRLQEAVLGATEVQIFRVDPCWYENQKARAQDTRLKVFGCPLVFGSVLREPRLVSNVIKSVCESLKDRAEDNSVAGCFEPRHALSFATKLGEGHILICYQCSMAEVEWSGESHMYRISSVSEAILESTLLSLGSPKPDLPSLRKEVSYKFRFDSEVPKIRLSEGHAQQPNQSLEPTGIAVTPSAAAEAAPAIPVAHH